MKKRLRIYVDTSVFGGYFDSEFLAETRPLWDRFFSGENTLILSSLTILELGRAPERVSCLIDRISKKNIEILNISDEARELAQEYIRHGALATNMENDALHIALATLGQVDVLVSWNFKHVVNFMKIKIYNGVNLEMGYFQIDIRTPREVVSNE